MALGKGKGFGVWIVFLAVTLYLPFRNFLSDQGYRSMDDFFADLLLTAILAAIIIIPIVLLYLLFFKGTEEKKRSSEQ